MTPVPPIQPPPEWLGDVDALFEGAFGRAWKFPMPADDSDWRVKAAVDANYLVFAPAAHPYWAWHVILCIALRDVPGQDAPPVKRFEEATHELLVLALSPDNAPPDPRSWPMSGREGRKLNWMMPPDAAVQFQVAHDGHAREIAEVAAKACTSGLLVPDTDHANHWQRSIEATAAHYRDGVHGSDHDHEDGTT